MQHKVNSETEAGGRPMTETTTLQDAYAPSIRRRQAIVERDYRDSAQSQPSEPTTSRSWLQYAGLVVTPAVAGGTGYFAAHATNTVMAEITINGQTGGSIDPLAFGVGVAMFGLLIASIPYLPGGMGR